MVFILVSRVINQKIHINRNFKRKETQSKSNKNYSEKDVIHKCSSGFSACGQRSRITSVVSYYSLF